MPGTQASGRIGAPTSGVDEGVLAERSLSDLFHLAGRVLPEEQELLAVAPDTSVRDALEVMSSRSFNQLPVVVGRRVLGVFSYRSFAQGVRKLSPKELRPLELDVSEFLEELQFASLETQLTRLLGEFDLRDAVLVGADDRLQGVITTTDALNYFYRVASPYVLLREIELSIRELIRHSTNETTLRQCIDQSLHTSYVDPDKRPRRVEELSFNDYVMLLRYKGTWSTFKRAFGGTPDIVYTKLHQLPNLRNDVFHFKRELSIEDYELLRDTRDWLLRCIRTVDETGKATDVR